MKLLNILNGTLIVEVSETLKKELVKKFKLETQDSEKKIIDYIEGFERYQQSLPTDKRDITRYDYKTLKSLIDSKENAKTRKADINSAITSIINKEMEKGEEAPPLEALKLAVKKFFEIQTEIKNAPKDINKYGYLKLIQFLENNYEQLLIEKLISKFKTENQTLTTEQILFYVNEYIQNFNEIPFQTPSADLMSFTQLEHLIDAMGAKKGLEKKTKTELEDVPVIYDDEKGFKIYAPTGKEHCIKLAHGRRFCIGWLGGANLYYNYRLRNGRTIYYVIDETLDYEDLHFVTVVLVDERGGTSFANKTNSRPFDGSQNMPWDEISGYVPKLKNLKNLFVSRPLSEDEIEMRDKYQNIEYDIRYGRRLPNNQTPMEYFESPREVALWMEIKSPDLFDEDYSSLPIDLKKKYISLGFELTSGQIKNSEKEVLDFYAKKKIEKIKQSTLRGLSDADIALLNSPVFKQIKESLKERFVQGLTAEGGKRLKIENLKSGDVGKFISLYGLNDIFDTLSDDMESISIFGNKDGSNQTIEIPRSLTRFKNLEQLILNDGIISELPDFICELKELTTIGIGGNPQLTSIPECIGLLPELEVVNMKGSPVKAPQSFEGKLEYMGDNIWVTP
jgi:hypothetical protein